MDKKIVFMIMCHKNAEQVIRLIQRCLTDRSDIIIHADAAMNEKEFYKIKEFCDSHQGVFLTDSRIHGELYTRSLVDITVIMMKKALELEYTHNEHYVYYSLLSGQCYPIAPVPEIIDSLFDIYPKPLIDCTPWAKKNWVWYKTKSNAALCQLNLRIALANKGLMKTVKRVPLHFCEWIMRVLKKDIHSILKQDGVEVFGGSQWWILPDIAVKDLVKEYDKADVSEVLLNKVFTPDETYFQTMIMRLSCSQNVEINQPDRVSQNCKTYAYFSDYDKPATGHPYTITREQFKEISNKDYWFARKFDTKIDSEVLNMIDVKLLKYKEGIGYEHIDSE